MPLLGPNGQPVVSGEVIDEVDETTTNDSPEATEPEPILALTAFVVYKTADGDTVMTSDVEGTAKQLTVVRPPSADEIKGMCHNTIDDVNHQGLIGVLQGLGQGIVQGTTMSVVNNLQAGAQRAMEQQQVEGLKRQLKL